MDRNDAQRDLDVAKHIYAHKDVHTFLIPETDWCGFPLEDKYKDNHLMIRYDDIVIKFEILDRPFWLMPSVLCIEYSLVDDKNEVINKFEYEVVNKDLCKQAYRLINEVTKYKHTLKMFEKNQSEKNFLDTFTAKYSRFKHRPNIILKYGNTEMGRCFKLYKQDTIIKIVDWKNARDDYTYTASYVDVYGEPIDINYFNRDELEFNCRGINLTTDNPQMDICVPYEPLNSSVGWAYATPQVEIKSDLDILSDRISKLEEKMNGHY